MLLVNNTMGHTKLKRKVLSVLKRHGPLVSGGLHFIFDPNHTAEIYSVLNGLRDHGYIDISRDNMATITPSGLKRLEKRKIRIE